MKGVINKLKLNSVSALTRLTLAAMDSARLQLETRASDTANLPTLRDESQRVAERFMVNLNASFDSLTNTQINMPDISGYVDQSQTNEDSIEAALAMEGMIKHARNYHVEENISFITRLNAIFPNLQIDETNNPLDPEQISTSFNEAIKPLNLNGQHLLTIYREFNKVVFHQLEVVLAGANEVMIDIGILPNLDIRARSKALQKSKRNRERPTTDRATRAFADGNAVSSATADSPESPDIFTMLQELLAQAVAPPGGLQELPVNTSTGQDQDSGGQLEPLLESLSTLQSVLDDRYHNKTEFETAASINEDVTQTICSSLQERVTATVLRPLSTREADTIKLVAHLFEAIALDESLPPAISVLIARAQLAITKIALDDTDFFQDKEHPARHLLNAFAQAGNSCIAHQDGDPTYHRIEELMNSLIRASLVSDSDLESLLQEVRDLGNEDEASTTPEELRTRDPADYSERLEYLNTFARNKINERILQTNLDPAIRSMLDTYFHQFLVKLILREGPGGSSWKPVMNTIDVLLWSISPDRNTGDRERFAKVNPRLHTNLGKALKIGGASSDDITRVLRHLEQVQDHSFNGSKMNAGNAPPAIASGLATVARDSANSPQPRSEQASLPHDDPSLQQVDELPIGIWLEFQGAGGQPLRCTLAARIDSIDKLFFVNHQGVKVIELTRMRLARELKLGTVKVVSEGNLVERAMESVISRLRQAAVAA